ncbi:MAG: phage holin family protein [Flavobacteriales bacterium]|jgi:hypothetical protein|nr:phage holin family protein [Flavobacteriales bacterium]MCI1753043.1 phage holin family protein [Flavobacteriales bacterium]
MSHQNNGGGDGYYADTAEQADIGEFLNSAIAEGKEYYAARKEHLTLQVYEQVGKAAGGMFGGLLAAVTVLMFLFFASLALSFWLGTVWENTALGFLAVGGIYLVAFLIVHFAARKSIRDSFMLNVINSFYDDKD